MTWVCFELHVGSTEELNHLLASLVSFLNDERKSNDLETYFYNKYQNLSAKKFFLKVGLANPNTTASNRLSAFLTNFNAKRIDYECETWQVDGMTIDLIKCISTEAYNQIRTKNQGKPLTIDQAFYFIHFLMNQMGYGYSDELAVYRKLTTSIEKQQETK